MARFYLMYTNECLKDLINEMKCRLWLYDYDRKRCNLLNTINWIVALIGPVISKRGKTGRENYRDITQKRHAMSKRFKVSLVALKALVK